MCLFVQNIKPNIFNNESEKNSNYIDITPNFWIELIMSLNVKTT
jgi:hypothetical protein